MIIRYSFAELATADLIVDAVYEGGTQRNAGDDPLHSLLAVSVMGGFRYRGSLESPELLVLTSSVSDPDWPDALDPETGVFTYYGDNKHPGRELHTTPRNGNEILRRIFEAAHGDETSRRRVPPIFVFRSTREGRSMRFLGLAVPGSHSLRHGEDLVALWKFSEGSRFQNYRAKFTILDVPRVPREWINRLIDRTAAEIDAPPQFRAWIKDGKPIPLIAPRAAEYRTKAEQLPSDPADKRMIRAVHEHFSSRPALFEECAAAIARMMLSDITTIDVTRPSRDGGRDALGKLRVGTDSAGILLEFALEAKCYDIGHAVGVRDVSRLISRLRHRQFGILVTTSYLALQAYKEIKEDQHPIIVISARDIVRLLRENGYGNVSAVRRWLAHSFPAILYSST